MILITQNRSDYGRILTRPQRQKRIVNEWPCMSARPLESIFRFSAGLAIRDWGLGIREGENPPPVFRIPNPQIPRTTCNLKALWSGCGGLRPRLWKVLSDVAGSGHWTTERRPSSAATPSDALVVKALGDLVVLEPRAQRRLLKLAGGRARNRVDELEGVGQPEPGEMRLRETRAAPRRDAVAPGFSTTVASGRSLHFADATGITAASATAGWPISADSSATELIHSPPDLIRSFDRS